VDRYPVGEAGQLVRQFFRRPAQENNIVEPGLAGGSRARGRHHVFRGRIQSDMEPVGLFAGAVENELAFAGADIDQRPRGRSGASAQPVAIKILNLAAEDPFEPGQIAVLSAAIKT